MNIYRTLAISLLAFGLGSTILAQKDRHSLFADEKKVKSARVDLSGFRSLLRQGKIKEATTLIDRLQVNYPEEQEVERYFVMLFICQERDAEVIARASQYVQMPELQAWLEIPKAKLSLRKLEAPAGANAKPQTANTAATQTSPLQKAYSQTLLSSNSKEWVKYGFLNRVFKDDPNNPEAICILFGTMSNAECVSKMKSFSLERLQTASNRANPNSSQKVLKKLIETKKWMTKNPNSIPYMWREATTTATHN